MDDARQGVAQVLCTRCERKKFCAENKCGLALDVWTSPRHRSRPQDLEERPRLRLRQSSVREGTPAQVRDRKPWRKVQNTRRRWRAEQTFRRTMPLRDVMRLFRLS